jgi:hypothetical protein
MNWSLCDISGSQGQSKKIANIWDAAPRSLEPARTLYDQAGCCLLKALLKYWMCLQNTKLFYKV